MDKQKGFSLIELMIAMLLGIIVTGGALSVYISSIRGSTDVVNSARLNYDLDAVMQLMVNDIRRAGYWGGAIAGSSSTTNPPDCNEGNIFTCGNANIQMPISSCILYTYDADSDGFINNGEYYGFKLEGGEIKLSSKDTLDDSGDCTKTGWWEAITDNNIINITALTFSNTNSQCLNTTTDEVYPGSCATAIAATTGTVGKVSSDDQAVEIRQIDINLQGNVDDESTVLKSLTAIVKVRNDRIFLQP